LGNSDIEFTFQIEYFYANCVYHEDIEERYRQINRYHRISCYTLH